VKRALYYGAVLIGTYLVVANATSAGRLIGAAGTSGSQLVKTFQGR
jgi:hypothetical protein